MHAVALPTRDHLVATARQLLDAEGLEPLTLREIARRAGVSHGAPLRHFPSLAALMAAVAAGGFRDLITSVDAAVAEAGPDATALERLAAAGRGYVGFAARSPGVFALMFHPDRSTRDDPDYREAGAAAFGQLVGLVDAAQARRLPARRSVDPARLGRVGRGARPRRSSSCTARSAAPAATSSTPTLGLMSELLLGVRADTPTSTPKEDLR